MSCNACSKQYGFFCKEVGCPSCGFSFCTKCLKKEIVVTKLSNSQRKVCLSCWDKITKGLDIKATSKSKSKPIQPSPMDEPIPDEVQTNLDKVLEQRLAALKQKDNDIVDDSNGSDEAIAIRIANLKDIPYSNTSNIDLLTAVDKRTDEQKINDIMKQFLSEQIIDNTAAETSSNSVEAIERRLAALRVDRTPAAAADDETIDEDDETRVQKVVKRYLDEATLPEVDQLTEEEQEFVRNADGKGKEDLEELPWCTICNEDAVVRCLGCDGDLFCRGCFKECHDDEDYRAHQTKPYENKKAVVS